MISGSNSLWERGYGNPEPQTVIAMGFDQPDIEALFKSCKIEGAFTNSWQLENEESYSPHIFVCRQPWLELWQSMRWFQ